MTTTGPVGGDTVAAELELYTHDVKEVKNVDIKSKSVKGEIDLGTPEPVTTRWELWAWYAYYFGNNSAGTLSYAPLSMIPPQPSNPELTSSSLPICPQSSRSQWTQSQRGLLC